MSNLAIQEIEQVTDSPQDRERLEVMQSGLAATVLGALSIVGLGTIGVPLSSVVGIGSLILATTGLGFVITDHVNNSDKWDELDKLDLDIINSIQGTHRNLLAEVKSIDVQSEVLSNPIVTLPESKLETIPVNPIIVPVIESLQTIATKPSFSSVRPEVVKPSFTNVIEMKSKKERPTAISIFLADPYESRCIFGAQRTGKSYFAAIVSRMQSELNTRIYHINLASYGTEDFLYWQHAYKSVCCDISSMDTYDAKFQIDKATQLIFDFYSDPNPSILIVDEIAYLGSTGNYHKDSLQKMVNVMADKITVLSSSGKKRKKAVWTIAPEFVAGAVTQDTKAIKKLTLCYLTIHPEKTVDWEGQDIGFNSSLFDQIKNNYPIYYPIDLPNDDRVAFISDQWMSIGELPSLEKKTAQTKTEPKLTITEHSEDTQAIYNRLMSQAMSSKDALLFKELKGMSDLSDPNVIERIQELNSVTC